jgi:hypothetical protein
VASALSAATLAPGSAAALARGVEGSARTVKVLTLLASVLISAATISTLISKSIKFESWAKDEDAVTSAPLLSIV